METPPDFLEPNSELPDARTVGATNLANTTFVVLDTETTGASPRSSALTEVAALKVRGGNVRGHFRSLVRTPLPIPPQIERLTGITDIMCALAPTEADVMTAFRSFVGGAVVVGHNLRFDLGFLNQALDRFQLPLLDSATLDTLTLARRVLPGEVPNFRLSTLATHLRLRPPSHRAFADVLATTDLMHALFERLGSTGVTTLEQINSNSSVTRPTSTSPRAHYTEPDLAELRSGPYHRWH